MALSPFDVVTQEAESKIAPPPPTSIILSQPYKVDLSVYRGDSGGFRITVTDPLGGPVDLTAATWDGDIRTKATDTTLVTSFEITPVAGDMSSVDVSLPAANSELLSGVMVYDIEMREGETVTTLIYGSISVIQDVSRP